MVKKLVNYPLKLSEIINWDKVIEECENNINEPITFTDDQTKNKLSKDLLEKVGYDLCKLKYNIFYPDRHFNKTVENFLEEILQIKAQKSFILKICPGRCIPYTRDVYDFDHNNLKRYTIFINNPIIGQIFLFENNNILYNIDKNSIYEWDNLNNYYSITNCGLYSFYTYHIIGLSTCLNT